jgi:FKBP-type peptidyl-prolyl cis-trans isomerase 2
MVEDGKVVSIEYKLSLADGTEVDSNVGKDPLSFKQGNEEVLPALQRALAGMSIGDTKRVTLQPDDAYGQVHPQGFHEVETQMIPEDARTPGTHLVAEGPEGESQHVRVHELKGDKIVLDFNHPLAGEVLTFDLKVVGVE